MWLSLSSFDCYIPEDHFCIDIAIDREKLGLSIEQAKIFKRFYGLNKIPVTKKTIKKLLLIMAKKILSDNSLGQIKYVITPRTAPLVAPFGRALGREVSQELGLDQAVSFAVSMNKCVSFLQSLSIANVLLQSSTLSDSVLILIAETVFTKGSRIIPNIAITADAAAGTLVKLTDESGDHRLLAYCSEIIGEYAEGTWMSNATVAKFGDVYDQYLAKVIRDALLKANIKLADLKLILPHNVNILCWQRLAKFIQFPLEKIYLKNIPKTSHCFNADLLINLKSVVSEGLLTKDDYYLMATVGVGAMFGAAVFQY